VLQHRHRLAHRHLSDSDTVRRARSVTRAETHVVRSVRDVQLHRQQGVHRSRVVSKVASAQGDVLRRLDRGYDVLAREDGTLHTLRRVVEGDQAPTPVRVGHWVVEHHEALAYVRRHTMALGEVVLTRDAVTDGGVGAPRLGARDDALRYPLWYDPCASGAKRCTATPVRCSGSTPSRSAAT
jgi:hypothetical protein